MRTIAADPGHFGARIGATFVLHTFLWSPRVWQALGYGGTFEEGRFVVRQLLQPVARQLAYRARPPRFDVAVISTRL